MNSFEFIFQYRHRSNFCTVGCYRISYHIGRRRLCTRSALKYGLSVVYFFTEKLKRNDPRVKAKKSKSEAHCFAIVTVIFYTVAFSCFSDTSIAKGTEINASMPLGARKEEDNAVILHRAAEKQK